MNDPRQTPKPLCRLCGRIARTRFNRNPITGVDSGLCRYHEKQFSKAPEKIAECDLCGRVDHHLRAGICDNCRELHAGHMEDLDATQPQDDDIHLGAEADVRHLPEAGLRAQDARFRNTGR